ncbi:MAG TPA: bifunctional [glutamine synthetase] adenylyltransferase/[glutamine synthetase]-adenylyl-L-tyrosine phosphorylase [Acidimicrobiia bacterium]|nr:bifunctional [glutamine synthetase] adenylyltransferase/[glutamine synthetase]-adenylyl-L-tyrosine phosphorylase [Acidimicrobiia bacterium]
MTARGASTARLGVGAAVLPRLEALGWIVEGQPAPEYQGMFGAVRGAPDPDGTWHRLATLADKGISLAGRVGEELAALASTSRSLWDSLLRHPEWLDEPATPGGDPRLYVQQRIFDIVLADIHHRWDLETVTLALSDLADETVAFTIENARSELAAKFPGIEEVALAVIALGKWGGRELNYSSDIDLLFVYAPGPGDADESRRLANKLATALIDGLSRPTYEGIAFRVDADLRPEGGTGPLVRTLDSYRTYYEKWGEAWEFQALLKARFAAGDRELGERFLSMVGEFVWPASISSDSIRLLRQLKKRSEEGADPDDIKRAPGGIRDVEFSVQLLQLVHGRADPQLRSPGTLPAIAALAAGGYVRQDDADSLADSYSFLRNVEHRLQVWQMAQTHRLPPDREQLAFAMGYRSSERSAVSQFNSDLSKHRHQVRSLHERLYYRPLLEAFAAASPAGLARDRAVARLEALGFVDLRLAAQAIEDLTAGMSRRSRLMQQLLPLMVEWLADTPNPDMGLSQLTTLVAASRDNAELTSILRDRPTVAQRLCHLLGSSRLVGTFLDRIPEFLPRLADDKLLLELPSSEDTVRALERMQLRPDRDARMASLRRLVRRRMLRTAAADLLGMADVDRVSAALTDTADAAALAGLWTASQVVGPLPFAVVAMGKWGGRELGYGSDLDLVYVIGSADDTQAGLRLAGEFAGVLGRHTSDGVAYEVDAGLRPEGKQGSLARSLDAFRSYYSKRAEPWELLALIKARPVAGDPAVRADFEELVRSQAFPEEVPLEMIRSVRSIKARVERERLPRGDDPDFHLKLGPGGLSDIEFLAQLWQLRLGRRHPELQTTSTLGALDQLAAIGTISAGEAEHLAITYRLCTQLRNRLFVQTGRSHDSLPLDGEEGARLARSLGYDSRSRLREEYRRTTRRARRIFEHRFFQD